MYVEDGRVREDASFGGQKKGSAASAGRWAPPLDAGACGGAFKRGGEVWCPRDRGVSDREIIAFVRENLGKIADAHEQAWRR